MHLIQPLLGRTERVTERTCNLGEGGAVGAVHGGEPVVKLRAHVADRDDGHRAGIHRIAKLLEKCELRCQLCGSRMHTRIFLEHEARGVYPAAHMQAHPITPCGSEGSAGDDVDHSGESLNFRIPQIPGKAIEARFVRRARRRRHTLRPRLFFVAQPSFFAAVLHLRRISLPAGPHE